MTMSSCYSVRMCPFCQAEVTEDPIITDTADPIDYKIERLKPYKHDPENQVYYMDEEVHSQVLGFNKFQCQKCHDKFNTFKQFSKHLFAAHHRKVCKICHKAGRVLPSQVESYTAKECTEHMKRHPACLVCPFVAFDQSMLADHMRENHFRCEVCATAGEVKWFADSDVLRVHFNECHYACQDPMCVEHGFIVFATPMELQLHMISVHGDRTPVMMDFKEEEKPIDFEKEHMERIKQARKALSTLIKSIWKGDNDKVSQILNLVDQVRKARMPPKVFLKKLSGICNKRTDSLFCAVVAAIDDPAIRAAIVRERSGFRPCSVPTRSKSMGEMVREEPTLVAPGPQRERSGPLPPSAPTAPGRKKGRGKKVVLTSY